MNIIPTNRSRRGVGGARPNADERAGLLKDDGI
jgi:hypothetical protein